MDLSGTNNENYRYVSHNQDERPALKELFQNNTVSSNQFVSKSLIIMAIINGIWMLNCIFDWSSFTFYQLLLFGITDVILVFSYFLTKEIGYTKPWMRTVLLSLIIFACVITRINLTNISLIIFILPIALSCRYYDDKFTVTMSCITFLAGLVTIIITAIVDVKFGFVDTSLIFANEPFQMGVSGSLGVSIINSKAFNEGEYILRSITFYAFQFVTIMIPLAYACYEVAKNGKRLILEVSLIQREKDNAVHEVQESKMETMISQIQPHFLYNALNSIYYLVDKDQKKAKQAIADFSDYLRTNLNFSKGSGLVPFTKELEHIKKYLALEKVRFEEDLNIEYDIKVTSFRVPSLTIQPLVENAVKHGISKKNGGGTLTIMTKEEHDNFLITIKDDGVGFNQYQKKDDNRRHIGLENSRFRLRSMCNASIDVNSELGVGTTIKIRIPKEYYYEDNSSR